MEYIKAILIQNTGIGMLYDGRRKHKVKDIPRLETKHINSPGFCALDQVFTGYQHK